MIEIIRANLENINEIASLFDEYRQFYKQPTNPIAARDFIHERISNDESVIYIAKIGDEFVGFTQLYPTFTSVGLARTWLLNDLYVKQEFRKRGVADHLIRAVIDFSKLTNRKKIFLSTAVDNIVAQQLYEKIGFVKDDFLNYEYVIK